MDARCVRLLEHRPRGDVIEYFEPLVHDVYGHLARKYLEEVDGMRVGGSGHLVVVDETSALCKRVRPGKRKPDRNGGRRAGHIHRRLAAVTVWKKPTANTVWKRPAGPHPPMVTQKALKRPAGRRWIWGCVSVGKSADRRRHCTPDRRQVRVHLGLLPGKDANGFCVLRAMPGNGRNGVSNEVRTDGSPQHF